MEYQAPVSERLRLHSGRQAGVRRLRLRPALRRPSSRPALARGRATEASFLSSARQNCSGAPNYRDLGDRLEFARSLRPCFTTFAQAPWHERRCRTRTHLDGPVCDATLRGSWVVAPTVRVDFSGGYAQQRPEFRRDRWLGTGVTVALPGGFTIDGGAEVR
ncbi:MAG: hypothetical protein OXI95_14525 [bacterium]|nr:hypothetical protein [bacterium]MDE0418133.1 hypothetical protein [bacterium]